MDIFKNVQNHFTRKLFDKKIGQFARSPENAVKKVCEKRVRCINIFIKK
uniref:Uncharacterized protein n=1 Tax=viral metagenome TaxID=1070528 RepID=A0A6C0I4D5_9ZZZZ